MMSKPLPPLTFRHDYQKLHGPGFSTIRRYDKNYQVGQKRMVRLADGTFRQCQIVLKYLKKLAEIPTMFLLYDTGCATRELGIQLLNSFYTNPIHNDELLTVLRCIWVD